MIFHSFEKCNRGVTQAEQYVFNENYYKQHLPEAKEETP